MDLRTKLVFALVGISLGSMAALGTFGYRQAGALLMETELEKLDAVAESRRQDLENVVQAWSDRVQLIASRTQLRLSLAAWARTGNGAERETMNRILDDARAAVRSVDYLALFDASGAPVAASWTDPTEGSANGLTLPDEATGRADAATGPVLLGLETTEDGRRQVRYLAPMHDADSGRVGWLVARLSAAELLALKDDVTGLGQTGETMIVQRTPDGARVLHPVRHPGLPAGSVITEPDRGGDPALIAADGRDIRTSEGLFDYRGERVWAATRHLPGPGWGIVVKVDAEEEERPIHDLRTGIIRLALSLSAFGILGGILLGLHLTRPIHELVDVANRIVGGETAARARVRTRDEVGVLARVFNRMADALTVRDVSISDDDLVADVEAARKALDRQEIAVPGAGPPSRPSDGGTEG
ncbi:MAG: HAMP domain-containing protein [Gemmatimonadota bacterium]|nr:HAMP domain-containing protein [Gemmatimonadota bacterium]